MKRKIKKEAKERNVEVKIPKKVGNFLDRAGAKFELLAHRTVYTAFDKAATLKVEPEVIAKVLTLKLDKELVLVIIGGDRNLDINKLLKLSKAKKIDFAKEKIIGETFKGIDPGAIPPLEGLWNLQIFCDKKFLEQTKIILSAGSYEASIKIAPGAFKKINPLLAIGNFSIARPKPKAPAKTSKTLKNKK